MEVNWKAVLLKPLWDSRSRKCRRILSKMEKDPERFSLQWRNDLLSKYSFKVLDGFNINVKITGYENLGKNGPALLVGNHQDTSDALIVLKALRKQNDDKEENHKIITFIAKESLKYENLIRYPLELIDVFFLERDNLRKSLETYKEFAKFIKINKTYGVVFPEGTRSKDGKISEFKPGALKIAQKELIPIIPFTINNSVRGMNWRRTEKLDVEIIFHKKIQPSSFINQSSQALSERVQKIVESNFIPPKFSFIPESEKSIIKQEAKKQKFIKKEKKAADKIIKEQEKQEKQLLKIRKQDELETKKFLEQEKKKKDKKQNKEKKKN